MEYGILTGRASVGISKLTPREVVNSLTQSNLKATQVVRESGWSASKLVRLLQTRIMKPDAEES